MNIQEAKQIKIADYLQSLGHSPIKQHGTNLWYKSPLRNESEASFKVNTTMNSWFDFGFGKGATSLTLPHICTHPTVCHTFYASWKSKHLMYMQPNLLFHSKLRSQALKEWRLGNLTIMHSCAIWKREK